MLQKVIKYVLYITIFLMPIFTLPWLLSSAAFQKEFMLSISVLVLLILWVIKCLTEKKIFLPWNKLSLMVLVVIVILGISTIFSIAPWQSFWGFGVNQAAFWDFLLFAIIFFFVAGFLTDKKDIAIITNIIMGSSVLTALVFLCQTWFKILPWEATRVAGWSSLESPYLLSLFSVCIIGLIIQNGGSSKNKENRKWIRVLTLLFLIITVILNFMVVVVVGYWLAWLGLIFFALIALILNVTHNLSEPKILFLPMLFLIISLFFLIARPTLPINFPLPAEVTLNYHTTLNIGVQTVKEGIKESLIGTGPSTFGYQYNLYRLQQLNTTDFWPIRFNQGRSAFISLLTTSGILGILGLLVFFAVAVWQGVKSISKNGNAKFFSGFLYLIFLWFIYPANLFLGFFLFLLLGLWAAVAQPLNQTVSQEGRGRNIGQCKELALIGDPFRVFSSILVLVVVLSFTLSGLWSVSKNYVAQLIYLKGIQISRNDIDQAIKYMARAAALNAQDFYLRGLSEAYLVKANNVLLDKNLSQSDKTAAFQQNVQVAITAAQLAKQKNPADSFNWFGLGLVYENLVPLLDGAEESAVAHYKHAMTLDPQNPQIPFQIGRVYYTAGQKAKSALNSLNQGGEVDSVKQAALQKVVDNSLQKAKDALNQSLELKPGFSPASEMMKQL